MKWLIQFAFWLVVLGARMAGAADLPDDLTGKKAGAFKAHLGQKVSLAGRLETGQQGYCLAGMGQEAVFYVIPEIPAKGGFRYPAEWERMLHQSVCVTGELRHRSFQRAAVHDPKMQIPPDYYYMVLQRTRVELLPEPKPPK